jgi:hypothetical protein
MDLIYPHGNGALMYVQRSLTREEQQGLEAHFAEGTPSRLVTELLRLIWYRRLWLACDCGRREQGAPPLLFVRRCGLDDFVLARMADRPPHARPCAFSQGPALPSAADRATAPPVLGALLYRWLAAAKLNVSFPAGDEDLWRSQDESLREVARSLDISPGRRLYTHSRTHPAGLPELLRRLTHSPPDEADPYPAAVYFQVVDTLAEEHLRAALYCPGLDLGPAVEGPCVATPQSLPGATSDPGPHAVLFGLGCDPVSGKPRGLGAFAQPVYSVSRCVPVDGPHERQTLTVLLKVQRDLLHSHDMVTAIRKTLADTALNERGIAFQMMGISANGRPVRGFDVVSGPGDFAASHDMPSSQDGAVLFHWTGAQDTARQLADHVFEAELRSHLLSQPERPYRRDRLPAAVTKASNGEVQVVIPTPPISGGA